MFHNTGITTETSTVPLVVNGAQPVWLTLNDARERAFTGEIVFETDPEVFAYLDHGIVYYAERATDASLGSRLLDAGVVDKAQLDRGTVRVGDIEHLGRLFDRDPSVDRDAVVVVAEAATEELIADLANRATARARVTAYRHHPSGVHRWFVAPLDPVAVQRPVSAVAQLDSTVVDQLPGLSFSEADELTIEWDEEFDDEFGGEFGGEFGVDRAEFDGDFDLSLLEVAELPVDEVEFLHTDEPDADFFELSLDDAEYADDGGVGPAFVDSVESVDELDVDVVVVDLDEVVLVLDEVVELETVEHGVDEAAPDSNQFEVEVPEVEVAEVPEVPDAEVAELAEASTVESSENDDFAVIWPDAPDESVDGDEGFTMPPLELGHEPDQDGGDVPDDVADAVRRAIAAIESASLAAPPAAEVTGQLPQVDDFAIEFADPAGTPSHDVAPATDSTAPSFDLFAPPAMSTRAEVLYGQMTDDGVIIEEQVVYSAEGNNDRSSALRRLIGSLRRREH